MSRFDLFPEVRSQSYTYFTCKKIPLCSVWFCPGLQPAPSLCGVAKHTQDTNTALLQGQGVGNEHDVT